MVFNQLDALQQWKNYQILKKIVCYYHVTYEFQGESTLYSFAWISRNSVVEACTISEVYMTATGCGFESRCCHVNFRYGTLFDQGVPWYLDRTIEFGFTLKVVRNMIITYSQLHLTGKYSQRSSIFWPVWLNGWIIIYELCRCRFESRCCHLKTISEL